MPKQLTLLDSKLKTCKVCYKQKSENEFYQGSNGSMCKECKKRQNKMWADQSARIPKTIPENERCNKCHRLKPSNSFSKNQRRLNGISHTCKECSSVNKKALSLKWSLGRNAPESKRCTICKQVKPASEFSPQRYNKSGLSSVCKVCHAIKENERRHTDPQYRNKARKNLLKIYGLSLNDYDLMLRRQSGKCAICGNSETTVFRGTLNSLPVDHDHKTGKVRSLLCHRCNQVLGHIDDDLSILQKMIAYLQSFKS